jgi:hypothetical protein
MDILVMKPVKAFIYQDHEAHIAVHQAALNDPLLRQQMQQNPMAGQMMAASQAHINEHLAFLYRRKIEEQLGAPLPAPNTSLPEDFEVQLSRLAAQAAQQLLQQNTQMAQQQQNAQAQQDPVVQMQQAELQLKQQREQREAAMDAAELQLKQQAQQQKVMLEQERIKSNERINNQNNQVKMIDKAAEIQRGRDGIPRSTGSGNK